MVQLQGKKLWKKDSEVEYSKFSKIKNFISACKTLLIQGMKPYVYSEYLRQTKELTWFQGGDNVVYRKKKLNY